MMFHVARLVHNKQRGTAIGLYKISKAFKSIKTIRVNPGERSLWWNWTRYTDYDTTQQRSDPKGVHRLALSHFSQVIVWGNQDRDRITLSIPFRSIA